MPDIVQRSPNSPILRPGDVRPSRPDMVVECLLNPGVFRFAGDICLLVRVAERPAQEAGKTSFPIMQDGAIRIISFDLDDPALELSDPREPRYAGETYLSTLSHLRLFKSRDGRVFRDSGLMLMGEGPLESYGIEDCRVAGMPDGDFLLSYTATSAVGYGVGLIRTRDWQEFERIGMILPPANKDCAIFEEKIGGEYLALHRPSGVGLGGHDIWLARSPDLRHWGRHACIASRRPGMWDSARIGAGAAPIRTERGWLAIYHAADSAHRYALGALLLDLDDPSRVLARSQAPIMTPSEPWEREGFFGDVVFTNGHIVDGDTVTLYYGAADSVVGRATLSIAEVLNALV